MTQSPGLARGPVAVTNPLEAWLSIEPAPESGCRCIERSANAVRQSVDHDPAGTTQCKLFLDAGKSRDTTFVSTELTGTCPRAVLASCECIPRLEKIGGGRLLYSATMPDRSRLETIVERLRETGATVSVVRLRYHEYADESAPLLTDKQREAFETAVASGYFDRPRDATLEDLAEELDISPSAVSHRLCSARRRIAEHYTESVTVDGD
ncbi:MAG: helix-turn-helix domain-containing protein [Halanaeroarchaeum sp.]